MLLFKEIVLKLANIITQLYHHTTHNNIITQHTTISSHTTQQYHYTPHNNIITQHTTIS